MHLVLPAAGPLRDLHGPSPKRFMLLIALLAAGCMKAFIGAGINLGRRSRGLGASPTSPSCPLCVLLCAGRMQSTYLQVLAKLRWTTRPP